MRCKIVLAIVLSGCALFGSRPSGPVANIERARSKALEDGSTLALLDYGTQFEFALKSSESEKLKADARFPQLVTDLMTTLDQAASKDHAAAGDLLAMKARVLYFLDRGPDANAAARASLTARPNFEAFHILSSTKPDPTALATACHDMHRSVASYFQAVAAGGTGGGIGDEVCEVVFTCAKIIAPGEMTADDQQNLVTCTNATARWKATEKREAENECLATCQRSHASCTASAEACVGEMRGCIAGCLPQ
jgi:hypothetical protein